MSNVIPIHATVESPFHVGDRIRKVRELCSYENRKVEFAALIGTDRGTLSKYEGGKQAPKVAVLHAISSVTGARFEFLAHGTGPVFDDAPAPGLNRPSTD